MASGSVTVKTLNGAHQASASSLCVIEGSALDGLVKSSAVVELRVRGRYWRMIQKQLQKAEEEKSRGKAPSFLIVRWVRCPGGKEPGQSESIGWLVGCLAGWRVLLSVTLKT